MNHSKKKASTCTKCGKEWQGLICLDCARKETPVGPPLKRIRKYGFKVGYRLRVEMHDLVKRRGAIPTECDPDSEAIKVSYLFVACDGKTYVSHDWLYQDGGGLAWSEPYPA